MGRKNREKRRIPKNRDIEEIVYKKIEKTKKEDKKTQKVINKKQETFKESLKVKNFCKRKDSQQAEQERRNAYLRAIGKVQEQEER